MPKNQLYLFDATAFCYRAFHALPGFATSTGQPTNAIYGFINMLNKVLKEKKPEFVAACFDISRDTFRKEKFAEYKIHRPPMPDALSSQVPIIKEVISAYGITIFEKQGYEADDIIATLVENAKRQDVVTTIVSSDKDILQLVGEDTTVLNPYKDEGVIYDERKVLERFGVGPEKITDIIALMGDDTDNIPGVPGIGEKTAVNLIKEFGSLEKLLAGLDKIKSQKLRSLIEDNIGKIKLSRDLAVLNADLDLDFSLDKLRIKEPNYEELFRLFKSLEFKAFLKDLEVKEDTLPTKEALDLPDEGLKGLIGEGDELILCQDGLDGLIISVKDKVFRLRVFGEGLKKILENPRIKKTGHDLKKIDIWLSQKGILLEGAYFDTMVAGYLINPSKSGYALTDLAWDYLGKFIKPGSLESIGAITLISELCPRLKEELENRKLWGLFNDIEMPLVEVLTQMELSGIKLDSQILAELSKDLEKRLIKLIEDIYRICGCQFNINSPKQLRDVLFEKLKLPVVKRSKSGPSTDEEVLRKLSKQHKLPHLLLEYRQLAKLKSTYIDVLPDLVDSEGRIHTCFNQAGTETGRLSSSEPNLQNIPIKTDLGRNIRRAIIAFDKESYLLSCDYSQIELRILAHLSKDKNLVLAFKNNLDIHRITASLIYGLKEKDITDSMRDTAKRVNFGIIYGLSSFGLARDLEISIDEASIFIEAYFSRYPQVKDYMDGQIRLARKEGFVFTILGRRRYIPEINNKNQGIRQFAERQAINTPIQGSASDLIKLAMVQIYKEIKEKGLRARMILQVHDELLFNVPKDEINDFIDLVKDRMENALKLEVPIKVDIKKGKNWLEMEDIK